MSKLDALLTSFRELGEDETYPETLVDDIQAARDEDMSVLQAKIDTLEAGNAEATTQITSLKNELYDLGKAAAATATDETPDDEVEDESEPANIDDFFEPVEGK